MWKRSKLKVLFIENKNLQLLTSKEFPGTTSGHSINEGMRRVKTYGKRTERCVQQDKWECSSDADSLGDIKSVDSKNEVSTLSKSETGRVECKEKASNYNRTDSEATLAHNDNANQDDFQISENIAGSDREASSPASIYKSPLSYAQDESESSEDEVAASLRPRRHRGRVVPSDSEDQLSALEEPSDIDALTGVLADLNLSPIQHSKTLLSSTPLTSPKFINIPVSTPDISFGSPKRQPSFLKRLSDMFSSPKSSPSLPSKKVNCDFDLSVAVKRKSKQGPAGDQPEVELKDLLEVCGQKDVSSWGQVLDTSELTSAGKIGEASFSEVFTFLQSNAETPARIVMKVIPFGCSMLVNESAQPSVRDIWTEVKITTALGSGEICEYTDGFIGVVGAKVIQGRYPQVLIDEWTRWDEEVKETENESPSMFDDTQLFCLLLLEDGGSDLESYPLKKWSTAWSCLTQVILSLAAAETLLNFEHRDLHVSNILITPTQNPETQTYLTSSIPSGGPSFRIPTFGVTAKIIDYTLSRLEQNGELFYLNLEDEGFFAGEGDYQFDIYRMMREETNEDWKGFHPKTNIYWIHYLLLKLLNEKHLPKPSRTSAKEKPYMQLLMEFEDRVMTYKNASEIVTAEDEMLQQALELRAE